MVNCPFTVDLVNLWKECEPRRKYISDLETNFAKLEHERDRLIAKKSARTRDISSAAFRGMAATDTLTGWLQRVENMEKELEEILGNEENPRQLPEKCTGGGCSCCCCCCYYTLQDCKSAYKLGRSVAEKLVEVKDLREESLNEADMFVRVNMEYLPVEDTIFGMDSIFKEVWNWLSSQESEEQNSRIARVCGMGGVGKTTLLKRINNEFFVQPHDFNHVIFVDATQSTRAESIQLTIGEKLGQPWPNNVTRSNINQELKKKKFVLFIDDPHKALTLTDIGIPTQHNGGNKYKVIFATRNKALSMGIGGDRYHKFTVGPLNKEDAQMLFDETVGENLLNLDEKIRHLANSITGLCDGLPLTLVTVGRAMASMETPEAWKHSVGKLRNSAPDFDGMDKVYQMFQVSYNGLKDTEQRCFLYASLFPKDARVEAEQLIEYWIGESFFDASGLSSLNEIRNHGHYIIGILRVANLLETGEDTKVVTKQEAGKNKKVATAQEAGEDKKVVEQEAGDDKKVVTMQETIRASAHWIAAKSRVRGNKFWLRSSVELAELPRGVNWAEVERISLVRCRLPKLSLTSCSNISTLILKDSNLSEKISFQQMSRLKVLDLSGCKLDRFPEDITALFTLQYLNLSRNYIPELPEAFKKLTMLKILDLSFTKVLRMIPPNVIGRLSKLQLLHMYSSGFENQIPEGSVLFGDGQAFLQELQSLDYLEDLRITVTHSAALQTLSRAAKSHLTHSLFITKCEESTSLRIEGLKNLNLLHVFKCPDLVNLSLVGDFTNLIHVEIESCWELKNLNWLRFAPALQSLKVIKCATIEEVISDIGTSSEAETHKKEKLFPMLRSIHLSHLEELTSIYNFPLPFPCLEEISVLYCPKMVKLPLDEDSAKKTLKFIRGHEKWWEELAFGDDNIDLKLSFKKYFIPVK